VGWIIEYSDDRRHTWSQSPADDGDKVWPDRESASKRRDKSLSASSVFPKLQGRIWRIREVPDAVRAVRECKE